jgi:hypothetical protein
MNFRDIDNPGDGLAAALDALRTDRGEALLVTSLDRISRNKTGLRAVASEPAAFDGVSRAAEASRSDRRRLTLLHLADVIRLSCAEQLWLFRLPSGERPSAPFVCANQ